MAFGKRIVFGVLALLGSAAQAVTLAYEPVGLGWSAAEVERATLGNVAAVVQRAEREGQLGCERHCERLGIVFARLVETVRQQSTRAASLGWTLSVVRLPDVDAFAMPGGQVVIGEPFIDRCGCSDEALAFVLAHEMAHSLLEHERQALSFARMLLPPQVPRSVADMYRELDFNFALLKAMEPVLQQGELEADELGLLLASAAGYRPERQLAFIEWEAARGNRATGLVATHPSAARRLSALRERLPLARRLWQEVATR